MNKCLYCGKPVKNKYCNVSCQNRHQKRGPSKKSIEKMKQTYANRWKTFKVRCHTCKKEFEIKEYNVDKPKKDKYFCCRSCAVTYTSNLTKDKKNKKISKTLRIKYNNFEIKPFKNFKLLRVKQCVKCKKIFITYSKKQKYCSNKCKPVYGWKPVHRKMKSNPTWWSNIQKRLYKDGIQKVGGGKTKWYNYKDIKVQGTFELRTCKILDELKSKNIIKEWEYTKDRFTYIGLDNKEHSYLVDFKVFKYDNTFYYLEVKGYEHENDKLKWEAVRNAGYELKVWFINDIIEQETALFNN